MRRNSDVSGLVAAQASLAAHHSRALDELKPLKAICATASLDDLLAMTETPSSTDANPAHAALRTRIAALSPADDADFTMRTAHRMTTMINAAPEQLSGAMLDRCLDAAGRFRHEPSRAAATSVIASTLNRIEPSQEQRMFDRLAEQIDGYPAQSRSGTLLSLAKNLFKTRDPLGAESLAHAGSNLDKVLARTRGIPDEARAPILKSAAQLLPYYAMGQCDWKRHTGDVIESVRDGNASAKTRAAVLPALEQSLEFCRQAIGGLITQDDFDHVAAQLAELRGQTS